MDISIIICTYNRCKSLEKVLESVSGLNGFPELSWETLVVDNNSSDNTKEVIERFVEKGKGNFRYVFEGQQGKSHALNAGVNAARGQILAFTDDDVDIHPDWLLNLKKAFAQYNCTGIGGKIIPSFPGKKPAWLRTDTPKPFMNALGSFDYGDECCDLKAPPFGANMAFARNAFIKHGPFRIDLGPIKGNAMGKGEDSEFSLRLLDRGEKLIYVPDALIFHQVQEEKLSKKSFQAYYFNYGRFRAKTTINDIPQNTIYYLGVPRYMFRMLFSKCLNWVFQLNKNKRFCLKLECYETLGKINEYYTLRHGQ